MNQDEKLEAILEYIALLLKKCEAISQVLNDKCMELEVRITAIEAYIERKESA